MKTITISICPDCPRKHTCNYAKLCGLIPKECPLPDVYSEVASLKLPHKILRGDSDMCPVIYIEGDKTHD